MDWFDFLLFTQLFPVRLGGKKRTKEIRVEKMEKKQKSHGQHEETDEEGNEGVEKDPEDYIADGIDRSEIYTPSPITSPRSSHIHTTPRSSDHANTGNCSSIITPRSSTSPFSPGHAKNGNHSTLYSKSSSVSATLSPSYTPPCENLRCLITGQHSQFSFH